jgi:hypothetical protein
MTHRSLTTASIALRALFVYASSSSSSSSSVSFELLSFFLCLPISSPSHFSLSLSSRSGFPLLCSPPLFQVRSVAQPTASLPQMPPVPKGEIWLYAQPNFTGQSFRAIISCADMKVMGCDDMISSVRCGPGKTNTFCVFLLCFSSSPALFSSLPLSLSLSLSVYLSLSAFSLLLPSPCLSFSSPLLLRLLPTGTAIEFAMDTNMAGQRQVFQGDAPDIGPFARRASSFTITLDGNPQGLATVRKRLRREREKERKKEREREREREREER